MPIEGLRTTCQGPPKQGHLEKRKKKPSYVVASKSVYVVLKFNRNQPRDDNGRWTDTGGSLKEFISEKLTPAQRAMQLELAKQAAKPVHKVKTAEEAVARVLKGENVEIQDTKDVHTVLKKLAEIAMDAEKLGSKAPNFDPCTITVKGVSLFCSEKLKTDEFPHGVPRIEMPQFKTKTPTPDSEADKLPRDENGEVNASAKFIEHLTKAGVKTKEKKVLARKLKASQAEMEGQKVASIMLNPKRDPKKAKIWVSRDGYVIDGHHTWAAAIGRDAEDGNLNNDTEMEVVVVDMPMSKVYHVAVEWTRKYGLPAQGVKKLDYGMVLRYAFA